MTFIVTTENPLNEVAAPSLPLATTLYSQQYQDQLNNVLRLYFNRLDSLFRQLETGSGSIDGSGLRLPYGAFSSDQDQITTANTATLMTLNTTDFANSVSISSSQITVATPGIYNLQFSVQFVNTDTAFQDVYIWLRQNGVDITGSTGFVSVPNRHAGTDGHAIIGWNYFLSMAANDYVEIYWSVPTIDVTIQHLAASSSPTKPSTQSVVATMSFVSALP
jgi:hypothetical protein